MAVMPGSCPSPPTSRTSSSGAGPCPQAAAPGRPHAAQPPARRCLAGARSRAGRPAAWGQQAQTVRWRAPKTPSAPPAPSLHRAGRDSGVKGGLLQEATSCPAASTSPAAVCCQGDWHHSPSPSLSSLSPPCLAHGPPGSQAAAAQLFLLSCTRDRLQIQDIAPGSAVSSLPSGEGVAARHQAPPGSR